MMPCDEAEALSLSAWDVPGPEVCCHDMCSCVFEMTWYLFVTLSKCTVSGCGLMVYGYHYLTRYDADSSVTMVVSSAYCLVHNNIQNRIYRLGFYVPALPILFFLSQHSHYSQLHFFDQPWH
jgi:hypothetical protein